MGKEYREMTAKEMLDWFNSTEYDELKEVFGLSDFSSILWYYSADTIIQKITKHEFYKKHPIKSNRGCACDCIWVDTCRIIRVDENGYKECVYEVNIPESEGNKKTFMEMILRQYVNIHEGEYFATLSEKCMIER